MTNYSAKTVDEFVAAALPDAIPHLMELREVVKSAIPDVEETIGYGKPYYKYHGWLAGFDTYKHHINFEIWDGLQDSDRKELEEKDYKTGSVSFQIRYDQKVPTVIMKRLLKVQAKLNESKKK